MDRTEHRFSPSGRLPGGDFRVRRQFCQQDGAEQQRECAAPPGHVCASAHGGVSGAQSRFAGADCPAGQPCRPACCRARCSADRRAHCPACCRAHCPADRRMESVHVSPPLPLRQCMRRGAFSCGAGGLPCGGVPFASPGLNPGGTYSPNKKGTRRGGLPCLPPACPDFSLLCSPHPPARARRALFPSGEGETKVFSCKGLRPLHPRAEPGRRLQPQQKRYPAGGLPCLPPACPACSLLYCPHPPDPLPLRGRGRP